VKVDAALALRK